MGSSLRLKLNNIPENFRRLIVCDKGLDLDVDISEKYGILSDEQAKKMKFVMASLFFKETSLGNLIQVLQKELALPLEKAKLLALDVAGMRLLVVKDWLGDDVSAYIKSLGGKEEDYLKYVEDIKRGADADDAYFKELEKAESIPDDKDWAVVDSKVVISPEGGAYVFDVNKEKDDSVRNLKEQVLDLLDPENEDLAEEYNSVLLQLLIDGGATVKAELERALYDNQERITSAPFVLDGKPSSGTVANWIKYFLATKGSAIFDNIGLSAFMVQSSNTKVLNDVEKARLHKLLMLYRNLKFFPDSMPKNTNGEGWEIIPTEVGEEAERQAKIVTEKQITENELKIIELRKVLAKYPEGSLARRAVEEEIKKYKQKT